MNLNAPDEWIARPAICAITGQLRGWRAINARSGARSLLLPTEEEAIAEAEKRNKA
jgi:hypothetical protein